jgi:cell division protein DivIC
MENITNSNDSTKPLFRRGLLRLPAWLKNKHVIASITFLALILFFDPNDLFTQYNRTKELKELQQSKKYYSDQINKEQKELDQLKNDPSTLEKYARENYYMKRDNEDLFIVPEEKSAK